MSDLLTQNNQTNVIFLDWCARLYQHDDYNGWEQWVSVTNYGTPTKNDAVTSIRVRDGCTFKAYRHTNKEDLLETLTSDVSLLKDNDEISSFSCSCFGKFTILKLGLSIKDNLTF